MMRARLWAMAGFVALIGTVETVGPLQAGTIVDRSALQTLLGGPGTLEDFESYSIPAGTSIGMGYGNLDSTSLINGQGPGLVIPGVTFSAATAFMVWDGAAFLGAPSREILALNGALGIDFTTPTQAFGVDLRAWSGSPATATLDVYAGDDTTLLATLGSIALSTSGVPVFAGYEDIGGIGRILLTQTGQSWSPIIDNLEFGNIPEPPRPPFVPPGLNPGDRYQLAFVTRGGYTATSSDINDYNAFVQQQAELSPLTAGVTWNAIGSTVSSNANITAPVTAPVYNLNGDLVATGFDDLWLAHDAPMSAPVAYDQFGDYLDSYVWTGATPNGGSFYRSELGRGEYGYSPVYGVSSSDRVSWMEADRFLPYDPATLLPLYALSEELVVPDASPVPEPTSLTMLAGIAVTLVCSAARKRILGRGHKVTGGKGT